MLLNATAHPVTLQKGQRLGGLLPLDDLPKSFVATEAKASSPSLTREEKLVKVLKELQFHEVLQDFPDERIKLQALIERHLDCFAAHDEDVGTVTLIEHEIPTGDHSPIRCKQRLFAPQQRKAIADEISKLKAGGFVRP